MKTMKHMKNPANPAANSQSMAMTELDTEDDAFMIFMPFMVKLFYGVPPGRRRR